MTILELEKAVETLSLAILMHASDDPQGHALRRLATKWQDRLDAHYREQDADIDDDSFADGEALASAGFGTDEDYQPGELL